MTMLTEIISIVSGIIIIIGVFLTSNQEKLIEPYYIRLLRGLTIELLVGFIVFILFYNLDISKLDVLHKPEFAIVPYCIVILLSFITYMWIDEKGNELNNIRRVKTKKSKTVRLKTKNNKIKFKFNTIQKKGVFVVHFLMAILSFIILLTSLSDNVPVDKKVKFLDILSGTLLPENINANEGEIHGTAFLFSSIILYIAFKLQINSVYNSTIRNHNKNFMKLHLIDGEVYESIRVISRNSDFIFIKDNLSENKITIPISQILKLT